MTPFRSLRIALPGVILFGHSLVAAPAAASATPDPASPAFRVSTVGHHGMPKNIVPKGAAWNFGPGSLWTHRGWQYAAYWDDARQVSVARRQLPDGAWAVVSLPGYQRTKNVNRGKGGAVSQGFGDGHEKVAMGISPDGVIHLAFDHHLSTLHYRTSRRPVAADPATQVWSADLFGPVQDHLGGPKLASVTYPSFTADGTRFVLYLRLGGGSGNANSHFFTYEAGRWTVNTEAASQFIDRRWSGGDRTVNAYPHGLVIHQGRRHLTWCWRDTPDASSCHDLCYAYSDDQGNTWLNNDGRVIARTGSSFITANTPGVSVWPIPPGTKYVNGGSMTVDAAGRVHVLVRGEDGSPAHFQRDPATGRWARHKSTVLGTLIAGPGDHLYVVSADGLHRTSAGAFGAMDALVTGQSSFFKDSTPGIDKTRAEHDGWVSAIGQNDKTVTVVDYWLGK
jgi:hypothetical protein